MPPIEQSTASLDKLRATASEKTKPPFLKPGNEGNGYTKNEHRDPLILTKTIDQAALYHRLIILHCCFVFVSHKNDIVELSVTLHTQL